MIDTIGIRCFVSECEALAQAHGNRFEPPELLRQMAANGELFYPRSG
jgi:3-hydroxyacyl-CoA dehydrogenase/enoyl-CoA hydratase/3-hydroxybutyryl-CoA epimerase